MVLLLLLVGCIHVSHDPGTDDSGRSCRTEGDCPGDHGCVDGTCAPWCASNDECPGAFACGDPRYSEPPTDAIGCIERCSDDWDCKAGTSCGPTGDCE